MHSIFYEYNTCVYNIFFIKTRVILASHHYRKQLNLLLAVGQLHPTDMLGHFKTRYHGSGVSQPTRGAWMLRSHVPAHCRPMHDAVFTASTAMERWGVLIDAAAVDVE
jgi:hypothetical protein